MINEIKTTKPLKVKDIKSIRNFVATVRGFILRMEDVGASDEVKSRYVFADILTKLTAEDQRAYRRSMIDTKKDESLQTLLEYLEESKCTFPESIRQQTRRQGSIAKVLIYAKLHVKFKDGGNFKCQKRKCT